MADNNNNRLTINIIVGIVAIGFVVGLNIIIDSLSQGHGGFLLYVEQAFLVLNALFAAWILIRFVHLIVWRAYDQRFAKPAPKKIKDLVSVSILVITAVYIISGIFKLPIWPIITASGIVGAGIAIALKEPLQDIFAGLMLDFENHVQVGDWIKLPPAAQIDNNLYAKVTNKSWRTTTMTTLHNDYLAVPNSLLVGSTLHNLNKPEKSFRLVLTLSLSQDIPIERGVRILKSALLTIPSLQAEGASAVFSTEISGKGTEYTIVFLVDSFETRLKKQQEVLIAIMNTLKSYGINLLESDGVYGFYPYSLEQEADRVSFADLIHQVDLFHNLNEKAVKKMRQGTVERHFKEGDIIFEEGDKGSTMFLISEGSVEVYKVDKKGNKSILATTNPGGYFGDMALLLGEKRTAFVRAITDVVAFEVSKEALEPLLKDNPKIAQDFSHIVAQRQQDTKSRLAKTRKRTKKEEDNLYNSILKGVQDYFRL